LIKLKKGVPGVVALLLQYWGSPACVFEWGLKDIKNSSVTSSSYPCILSIKIIRFALVKRATALGCSCNWLEFKGYFLIKPPGMVLSPLTIGGIRGEEVRWLDGYIISIRTVGPTSQS